MDDELIRSFHMMWDPFPGMARLISKKHMVLASNAAAQEKGFIPGAVCAKVGAPAIHRECKLMKALQTGEAQYDRRLPDRIRGWIPLKEYADTVVHFAIMIPEEPEKEGKK